MSDLLSRRLALLGAAANLPLLTECLHGIERECLRVDSDGKLALTPTPGPGFDPDPSADHYRLLRGLAGVHHAHGNRRRRHSGRSPSASTASPVRNWTANTCGAHRCPASCRTRRASRSPATAAR
ncbi:hypothetical protein P4131_15860 [Pseudomonas aeruginosa]|nr:hypothetical protein [Pseudomonas aeruginosa]